MRRFLCEVRPGGRIRPAVLVAVGAALYGDGVVCVKTNPAGNGAPAHRLYAYNVVDDNSSATTG